MDWIEPEDCVETRQRQAIGVIIFGSAVFVLVYWATFVAMMRPFGMLLAELEIVGIAALLAVISEIARETRGQIHIHDADVSFVSRSGKILLKATVISRPRFVWGLVPAGAVFVRTRIGSLYWFPGPSANPLRAS